MIVCTAFAKKGYANKCVKGEYIEKRESVLDCFVCDMKCGCLLYIKSIDQRIADFFPEYIDQSSDSNLKNLTLKHLITMTSGFRWDDYQDMGNIMNNIGYKGHNETKI